MQGRKDIPLSPRGRWLLRGRRIPGEFQHYRWVASPLRRTMETAVLLGGDNVFPEPLLMEMDWGEWEGRTLADLRHLHGAAMADNEARGLDFQPRGGESPRMVQGRIQRLLEALANDTVPTIAVTHKGVIRAAVSMATGWNMLGKAPCALDWACAHGFELGNDGRLHLVRPNLPLGHGRTVEAGHG